MVKLAKIVTVGAIALFALIGVVGVVKKRGEERSLNEGSVAVSLHQVGAGRQARPAESSGGATGAPQKPSSPPTPSAKPPSPPAPPPSKPPPPQQPSLESEEQEIDQQLIPASADSFPEIDRIHQLFTTGPMKMPIVETITYTSAVPWVKGRPAWVADYAAYYDTSRHFIARSLNGRADYFSQKVTNKSRFNVFKKDRNINFYLLIDLSRCKMGFYCVDLDTQERVLLKTYNVGLGRLHSDSPSGCLTPMGKYSLGSKVAIYKPGVMGYFQDETTEMIQVFGTRWIPFDEELEGATTPSKGYGIHGVPWVRSEETGELTEMRACVGKYDSDGCIRLNQEDIEEIFAIVITKPTYAVIVKDFNEAKLPGKEVVTFSR